MWYKNVGTSFFRFVTIHTFDRRTDRKALQYHELHYMQSHGKNDENIKQYTLLPYCNLSPALKTISKENET